MRRHPGCHRSRGGPILNGKHTKPVEARTEDRLGADETAFPVVVPFEGCVQYFGLSKRELFAIAAMQGLASDPEMNDFNNIAGDAVKLADALLKELAK